VPVSRFWLQWTWRDFRSRWAQILATALVLAVGVGGFAGLRSLEQWRVDSANESLAALKAHDLRIDLVDGTFVSRGRLQDVLEGVSGDAIAAAQERLVALSQLEVTDGGEAVIVPARLVGAPGKLGSEPVDTVATTAGARGPVILDQSFASYHELPVSGRLRIAGLGRIPYQGVGVSPQYFVIVDEGGISGAESSLAVVYVPLADAQRAAGRPGFVNQLLIRTRPGSDVEELERSVRQELASALPGKPVTITRADQEPSTRIILRDAHNDQKTYTVFAVLLLLGAALAAFNLVGRVVEAQRREIGIGMALGAERSLLARRPLLLALQIGVLGALLGLPVGIGLAELIKGLLRDAQPLPVYASTFPAGLYAQATALALAIPLLAAALPVRHAIRVQPVEAIRAGYRAAKGSSGAARLMRGLHPPGGALAQLPLRNLARSPRRTAMTLIGLGAVMTAVVGVFGMVDSIGNAAERSEAEARAGAPNRLDVTLSGLEPSQGGTVRRVASTRGVSDAEPGLTVPATVRGGSESLDVALSFVDPDSALWHPTLERGEFSGSGIVLAEKAAEDLGVGLGDTVTLRHPRRQGDATTLTDTRVSVSGIHANPIRAFAYMDRGEASSLGLGGVANELVLVPNAGTPAAAIQRELFGQPGVASAQPASAAADALEATVESYSGAIQMVIFITLGLGLLVAFTSASVSIDERRREYATMFAFGVPLPTGLRVAVVESVVTGVLGTLLGLGVGLAVADWIVASLLSETFPDLGFETTLTAGSIAITVLVGVGAVALAPLLAFRRMRRMNIPSTLRVME
jgi:putative ABC transport system permease protein